MIRYKLCFELEDKNGSVMPNMHRLKPVIEKRSGMKVRVSKFERLEEDETI